MSRSITCSNKDGYTLVFREDGFSPFLLASVDGIYEVENDVSMTQNTMIDGGTYQGMVAKIRNPVLTIMYNVNTRYAQEERDILHQLFKQDDVGTLIYEENGVKRKADYVVEYIRPIAGKPMFTISLKCEDSAFYDINEYTATMATWVPKFEFSHEFSADKEEFASRESVALRNIRNDTALEKIGLNITITANGEIRNPSLTHVEKDEHIAIGSDNYPLVMEFGDKIIITTTDGNKHVYLVHSGIQVEVNEYLTDDSEFIQLQRGDNHIGYGANSGSENMSVVIKYRLKYASA